MVGSARRWGQSECGGVRGAGGLGAQDEGGPRGAPPRLKCWGKRVLTVVLVDKPCGRPDNMSRPQALGSDRQKRAEATAYGRAERIY